MTTRRASSFGSNDGMSLSFPPFTKVVKWIIGINVVLFFVHGIAGMVAKPVAQAMDRFLPLIPADVVHGWVWQVATYTFVNFSPLGLIFGMLIVWMLGAQLEATFGRRWMIRYYAICAVGGALTSIGLGYSRVIAGAENVPIGGVASIYYGMLIAYGVLFADSEFFLFPLPISMKAKYLVGVTLVVAILLSVTGPGGLLSLGQLGGLIAGYLYIKLFHHGRRLAFAPASGRGLSDRYEPRKQPQPGFFTRMKNSYYRWKRRRAARKFEVYMKQHNRDVRFDEYGNYIPPEEPKKGNGEGRGGWVN